MDLSLDSVRMALLDGGAISCECHVIDDTPRFLIIVILKTNICDCSVAHSFLTSSLSLTQRHAHTPHPSHVVVTSWTLCVPCTNKDFSLDSVSIVLRDGASSSECHVVDDTPFFLTIVILPPNTCDCSVTNLLFTSSPSLLCTSTHTPHPSHMWLFLHPH